MTRATDPAVPLARQKANPRARVSLALPLLWTRLLKNFGTKNGLRRNKSLLLLPWRCQSSHSEMLPLL
jgi:hypothetical protein